MKMEPIGPFNQAERETAQDLLDAGYRPTDQPGYIQREYGPTVLTSLALWNAMRAILAGE